MIVLGILLSVSLVGTGFVSWRLWHHLHGKKENTRRDKQENIEMVEENNAVSYSRERGTPLYSGICSVASVENLYQGLQHMNAFYENADVAQMKKKDENEAYENVEQVRRFMRHFKESKPFNLDSLDVNPFRSQGVEESGYFWGEIGLI